MRSFLLIVKDIRLMFFSIHIMGNSFDLQPSLWYHLCCKKAITAQIEGSKWFLTIGWDTSKLMPYILYSLQILSCFRRRIQLVTKISSKWQYGIKPLKQNFQSGRKIIINSDKYALRKATPDPIGRSDWEGLDTNRQMYKIKTSQMIHWHCPYG